MVFRIDNVDDDPRRLTQAALQITGLLGLYQAELARVLRVNCGVVGQLASGRRCLEPGTDAWQQASQLVRLYQALYVHLDGDGAAMCHWLRVPHPLLGGVPHLLMVDDGRLDDVVRGLERMTGRQAGERQE